MKKEQRKAVKTKEKSVSVKRKPEEKKPQKQLVTGRTEILDFDLEEEIEMGDKGAAAVKSSKKKVQTGDDNKGTKKSKAAVKDESFLEFVPKKMKADGKKAPRVQKVSGGKAVPAREPSKKRDAEEKTLRAKETPARELPKKKEPVEKAAPRKESAKKGEAVEKVSQRKAAPEKKKRKRSGGEFGAMDVVIALMGVLVVAVAVATVGIYSNARTMNEQVTAMAAVGEKMETIGIGGESVLMAVADNRIAGLEAAGLETEAEEETGQEPVTYEEKELTTEVKVVLKLTSVQKDLKIKFTNKESGKLVGNQAFTVKISGPETLTKTDDDKDGIIYINSITPGEYTVTVTGPEEIDGNPVSGVKGNVTVKDKIEYKKIDVADEVKKESEINVAKEDTAVVNQVESALTDTVEWVESTKTPLDGAGTDYEEVKKSDIPDPSSTAVLDMIWAADLANGSYLARDFAQSEDAAAFGVYFTQETVQGAAQQPGETAAAPETKAAPESKAPETKTEPESKPEQESTATAEPTAPPETAPPSETVKLEVTKVSISGGGDYTAGDAVTLTGEAQTSGEGSLSEEDYVWSGDLSGTGKSLKVPTDSSKSYSVTLTVKGISASATVNVKDKPSEVSSVTVKADSRAEVGKNAAAAATVTMSDGSAYSGSISWRAEGGQVSGDGQNVTVTGQNAGKVKVTASAGGKEGSAEIEFYKPDSKVTGIKIPVSASVAVGKTASLSVLEIQPADAANKEVDWKVTEGDAASVDAKGTVKGNKAGTVKIQAFAKDGSNVSSNVCTVTVTDGIGVTLDDPGSMKIGEEKQLTCKVTGEEESRKWSTSDSMIAAIEEKGGKVLAISAGKVTVTVTVKGKNGQEVSASKELVVNAADVEGIKIEPSSLKLKVDEKNTVKATVTTSGSQAVEWKSEDESIVKIVESSDNSCKVQGIKAGKTKVTAVSRENKDKRASCEITVEASDGSALLKDKNGNQLYYKDGEEYKAATVADYYKYEVFYRKKDASGYKYTGWQNIDGKRYYFDKNGNYVTGEQTIQGMKYSFNSDGSLQVNGVMGIDVSKHNGSIDWNAVKNSGVNYVIIRCGYRGSATGVLVEDEKFRSNIKGAAAAGLKVGVYFFSQAVNEVEAVEEASLALDLIRSYNLSYPVYMDVESANGRADGLDAGTRTKVIQAFCEVIRDGGYTAGVYANRTWLGSKMNVGALGNYKIWLAQYAATPTYNGRYEMWQYSSKGRIAGISGDVDLNISYMSY